MINLSKYSPSNQLAIDYSQPMKGQPRPDAWDDFWFMDRGDDVDSVSVDSALQISAVFACVKVLTESIAQLPWIVYERLGEYGEKGSKPAYNYGLYDVLHNRPNLWQTPFEYKSMIVGHAVIRGNHYSQIISGKRGYVDQLVPLNPDRMEVFQLKDTTLLYKYRRPNGDVIDFTQDEIFHVRNMPMDGIIGLDPVSYARRNLSLAQNAETHGLAFFRNGARPGGVLKSPKPLTRETVDTLRRTWNEIHQGSRNYSKVAILEDGLDYKELGITNENAQFLETRNFQLRDIARMFRVPPHKIADLERATFSNIEHQALEFITDTIGPWMRCIEDASHRDLVVDNNKYYTKFRPEAMLRGDIVTRYRAYQTGLQCGWLSVNDIRRKEDMNPIESGDTYVQMANLMPTNQRKENE